jgi:hypothetical protein
VRGCSSLAKYSSRKAQDELSLSYPVSLVRNAHSSIAFSARLPAPRYASIAAIPTNRWSALQGAWAVMVVAAILTSRRRDFVILVWCAHALELSDADVEQHLITAARACALFDPPCPDTDVSAHDPPTSSES